VITVEASPVLAKQATAINTTFNTFFFIFPSSQKSNNYLIASDFSDKLYLC
jgi:hypothetical protein